MPEEAMEFIDAFDGRFSVKPFSFELEIPE
jgi:hypothetical protein